MALTKAATKRVIQEFIDSRFREAQSRVEALTPEQANPQVALMVEKNRGYMLALQDVTAALYANRVF